MTDKAWKTYEEVAKYLLDSHAKEFGLKKVEGKQSIPGNCSGTNWTIDAKGVNDNGEEFVIIECRRYTKSKQNQEKVGVLAYRIKDTGSSGGIIVSPLGLQSGAKKIASAADILAIELRTANFYNLNEIACLLIHLLRCIKGPIGPLLNL